MDGNAAAAANLDGLPVGVCEAVAEGVADVGDVDAAGGGDGAAQLHELVGASVAPRRIGEAG